MNKILGMFVIFFATSVSAKIPSIVAVVNDQVITKYGFELKKEMLIKTGLIDASDPKIKPIINNIVLDFLIEEELLNQSLQKQNSHPDEIVTNEMLNEAITNIAKENKLTKRELLESLKKQGVKIKDFQDQIKKTLIRNQIAMGFAQGVSVSQNEIDVVLSNSDQQKVNVKGSIFISKDDNNDTLSKMHQLKDKFISSNNTNYEFYKSFAQKNQISSVLRSLPYKTQSVITDTDVNSTSEIYKEDDKFKFVFVSEKDRVISDANLKQVRDLLLYQKTSQEVYKFFQNLKSTAYIEKRVIIR